MKITRVKTLLTSPSQTYLFVKIETESGLYGWGDCSLNGREETVANLIDSYLGPMLIGRDASDIEDIWHLIYQGTYWRGGNVLMSALSGIDMALWDILGKECGKPLYKLLGGKMRDGVLCYAHILGDTYEEKISKVAEYVKDRKLKVIRLRVGQPAAFGTFGKQECKGPKVEPWNQQEEMEKTVEFFRKTREVVGPDIGIVYDLHERFSPSQAIWIMNRLEQYNPYFVEDPISIDCVESLRSVRAKTRVPIAMGELYKSRWECLPAITERLVDYLRCDIVRIGGITEAKKLAALAETYEVKTAWHGPNDVSPITHAINWHLNVCSYNFGIQEDGTMDGEIRSVVSGGPVYRDGSLIMEDRPGIGCDVNEETASEYPFRKAYLPYCRSSDGSIVPW